MNSIEDHVKVNHPKFKDEKLVYSLGSDWTRLKEDVDRIRGISFVWGNLAFTILGFGLSALLSVALYHASSQHAIGWVLGTGYTGGSFCLIASCLMYLLQHTKQSDPLVIKEALKKTIAVIEAKQVLENDLDEKQEKAASIAVSLDLAVMKEKSFKSLTTKVLAKGDKNG